MNLSVIIPVYNDTSALEALCQRIFCIAEQLQLSTEIILVEDSTDMTEWQKLLNLKQTFQQQNMTLVRLNKNVGQHYATWLGLMQAKGDLLVTMDADLQHLPESLPSLINTMNQQKASLVYGYGTEGHTKIKQISSWLFRLLSFQLNKPAAIYAKGYRLMTHELFQASLAKQPLFASIDTPLQQQAKIIRAINVPHQKRSQGVSHYTTRDRWHLALRFILLNDATYRQGITLLLLSLAIFAFAAWVSHSPIHTLLAITSLVALLFIGQHYKAAKSAMLELPKAISQIKT